MRTPFGLEEIDGTTLGRIEDVLHLRESADPDPRRAAMIRAIRALRENFRTMRESTRALGESSHELARVMEELAALERTSLGTSHARRVRSAATPRGIAEILHRHEEHRTTWGASRSSGYGEAGPTVLRIVLGGRLRRLREAAGITVLEAATGIRASQSKISRIELGRNAIREADLFDLLRLYGTSPEENEELLALAEASNRTEWWSRYAGILPSWYDAYLGLESAVTLLNAYEMRYIPDLLQTPEYAAEILAPARKPSGEVEKYLQLIRERQRRFEGGSARLWVIIDEAVLRREVGGKKVLLDQLRYLMEAAEAPNISLQVAPLGTEYMVGNSFSILRFREEDLPDTVYMENLTSAILLDNEADIDSYQKVMWKLGSISSDPGETPRIIKAIIREIERGIAASERS